MTERARSAELLRLAKGALTYLVPLVFTRGLSFLLVPVYTRYMTPDEYGIVGVSMSIIPVLALLYGLSSHSAPSRLYYTLPDQAARERMNGTVMTFLFIFPVAIAGIVELLGSTHMIAPFRTVAYDPYLRLVNWASCLVLYSNVTLNMLIVKERHRLAAFYNALLALSTAAFTVTFVVFLRRGAAGQLTAVLLTNGVMAIFGISILWKFGRPTLDWTILKEALTFSLPLVPHELSKWVLAASDRMILERTVSTAELGVYTLGYSFGATVGIFLSAIGNAFFPIVSRKLAEGDPSKEVPLLGSAVVFVSSVAAMLAASLFPAIIRLVTPATYHAAGRIVPLTATAFFFQSLFTVWSQGTFFSKRTKAVAGVTLIGAAVDVCLTFLLVPKLGAIAAAIASCFGFATMAVLHARLGNKVFPIPWEYGRTARIALAAVVSWATTAFVRLEPKNELVARAAILLFVFPIAMVVLRVFSRHELILLRSRLQRRRG
jgi:O-antigen/teichoic acid export membrane protein